jgi:hypothetical protein
VSTGTHTEHEDQPWTTNVGDHPKRADSPLYTRSRKCMIAAVQTTQPWYFGDRPYQDHHGGGVWLKDADGWFLIKNLAGLEWSSQFCADPAKVELLRKNAERLVAGFPDTEDAYVTELGMTETDLKILHTPITDADGVAAWTDSFWNASVPLPAGMHTGTLGSGDHQSAGVHHYPTPITDIETFKRDDFTLFVHDPTTKKMVAVLPVAPVGSGDGRVMIAWHPTDPALEHTVIEADHPLAKLAFARQESK